MSKPIILISFLLLFTLNVSATDIAEIRSLFYEASTDESSAVQMAKLLSHINEHDNPILIGYKGMSYFLMAKYIYNPFEKIRYFRSGRKILEKAIQLDPKSIELRFLRFAVQSNVPFFMNYNESITMDKKFIMRNLNTVIDETVKRNIVNYMLQSKMCGAEEEKILLTCIRKPQYH